jgi:hypothetical protein
MAGLKIGGFAIGKAVEKKSFPVNVLCFETVSDGRRLLKIGQNGLAIGAFQIGQELLPEQV